LIIHLEWARNKVYENAYLEYIGNNKSCNIIVFFENGLNIKNFNFLYLALTLLKKIFFFNNEHIRPEGVTQNNFIVPSGNIYALRAIDGTRRVRIENSYSAVSIGDIEDISNGTLIINKSGIENIGYGCGESLLI
jgi:hypothetical protein